jgi:amino acid adenylation domain-containing protein
MTISMEALAGSRPARVTDDWRNLLDRWNDTQADFPQVCAHELFERQAAHSPDAVAVVFGDRQVSYRELNERANRVAHHLRNRGVGPDVLVGVCLNRSPELVVALLAVWKAGGAYVPLDPAYPPERLSFMIGDAQPLVLLTEDKCRPLFSSAGDNMICLDSDWPRLAQEADDNLPPVAGAENLAYVIYTSGSTGRPKGAMIVHRGLVNYLWWAITAYRVEPGRSAPVHTSISFDLTVTSLFTPLLAGGTVELLPEDVGAQNLLAALRRQGDRSLVKITPAHLELLGQQLTPEQVPGMCRTFVIGGENLLAENLRLWREHAPATRLINEYGPTETVVGCCVHEVLPTDPPSGSVPIGRPIANTQLYVLDENLEPVPPGDMGELYIGGAGVARGYLNRPELTAERFLPDPFSGVSGARLYKSGDLARFRMDGTLEYLGRADDQVKIRGYRIELGEIEATLASHERVRSCAVLAREDEPGDRQLVAYVVPRDREAPGTDSMRAFLRERLPDYMVPARFVHLASLPLTPNGKIDRKSLPAPSRDVSGDGEGGEPRTDTEKRVAAIWSEVLKLDGIGIHDDFFDLGGDSMAAVALVAHLHETFDLELDFAGLFDRPTIAGLSELVDVFVLTNRRSGAAAGSAEREEFEL